MNARRLPDGSIEAPIRVVGPNGEIGDGLGIIHPGDPYFDLWDEYLSDDGDEQGR